MSDRSSSDAPAARPSEGAARVPLLQLQEEHDRLKATLAALPDILFVVDRDGRIYDFHSPRPERLYVPPETFMGRKMGDLLPEPAASTIRSAIEETVETGHHQGGIYPLATPAGERWFEMSIAAQGDPRTPEGRLVFLARDITDRKQAETDLEDAYAWLKTTLKALPDILFVVDRAGRILDYHAPRLSMMLIPPEQFLGKTIPEVVSESSAKILRDALRKVAAEGPQEGVVFSIPLPEGERWYEASIAAQGDPQSPDARFVAIVRDIHDRRRAEEQLRESEERFDQSARQSRTVLWEVDAHGLYTFASPVVEDVLGYRPEELVGQRHFYDLFPGTDRAAFKAEIFEVMRRRGSFRDYENPCQAKHGRVVWVTTSAIPLLDADGTLRGYRGSDTDITARKQAEEALRESEMRLRMLNDNLPGGLVYQMDSGVDGRERRLLAVSKGVERLHGVTAEEALLNHKTFYLQVVEEDQAMVAELEARAIATLTPFRAEVRCRLPGGEIRWIYVSSAPRRLPNNHVVWDGIELDITERKRAEENLRTSETKYRLLHETMRDAFASADMEGHILDTNPAFQILTGYSENELRGMDYRKLTPEKWHAAEAKILAEQVLPRGYSDVYPKEYVRKDGTTVPVELRTILILDEAGQPAGMWAAIRDVTARVRIERALKQATGALDRRVKERTAELEASRQALALSEAQFQQMAGSIQEVFWLFDLRTEKLLYVSPAVEQIWGRPLGATIPTLSEWLESVHPDDRARVEKLFGREAETDQMTAMEYRIQRPDGSVRWVEDRAWGIRDRQGRMFRVAGVIRDVTERRRLEAELLDAVEVERLRIGRDLHDSLGQSLTGIGYLAEALREELARQGRPEAADAEKLAHLIEEAAGKSHAMARGLLLVDLKRGGVASALQELAIQTQELFGVTCRYEGLAEADLGRVDAPAQLYRIAQEAATNAAKHSHGKEITIELTAKQEGFLLTVRDAGKGLPRGKRKPKGLGLDIMRYRASIIGASFWIESSPKKGTAVYCLLPGAVPSPEKSP